jgi:hypothetical protein
MNETFGEHSPSIMLENCSGKGKIARVETRAAWAMENKLFVMTFKCLRFISSSSNGLLLLAVNMRTLTGDEFSSSIILRFKFEAGFELIIYAVGKNLIKHGFQFCSSFTAKYVGAWQVFRDSFVVLISNSLRTCGISSV